MQNRIYLILIFFFIMSAAYSQHSQHTSEEIPSGKTAIEQASCPYLTKSLKGEILLSWVKTKGDESVMCFATSKDKGSSFVDTTEIAVSKGLAPHGENLPKIVGKADGEIIAVWGTKNSNPKNKYSGLIFYSQSFDNGKTWLEAKPIVKNPESFDQRYFDLATLSNGEAAIVWLDNPNNPDTEGSFIYYAATSGKNGFQDEKQIGETTCQCCRTDILVDQKGNIHVAYRDILNDSIRDMVHSVSTDEGKTFSKPNRISQDNWKISGCPHTGPSMAANERGLHFVWFTKGGETGVYYTQSIDNGQKFKQRELLKTTARHPQMTSLSKGSIAITWEEETGNSSNSFIMLQVMKDNSKKVSYKVSDDKGKNSFPVLLEGDQDTVLMAWVKEVAQDAPSSNNKGALKNVIGFKKIIMN